ncbi:MAG TPA: caspase family protein [Nordella sp.]|nr:caspase family protein [Nordella sp.]
MMHSRYPIETADPDSNVAVGPSVKVAPPSWLLVIVLLGLTTFLATSAVDAGVKKLPGYSEPTLDEWCELNDCLPIFNEIVNNNQAARLRLLEGQPVERFDTQSPPSTCRMNRPLQSTYFALLVAPGYKGGTLPALEGPANDAAYLSEVLKERGVSPEHIVLATGDTLDRARIIQSMREVLACIRAGDQLFFAFSGHGTRLPLLPAQPIGTDVAKACAAAPALAKTGLCAKDTSATKSWKTLEQLYQAVDSSSDAAETRYSLLVLTNTTYDLNHQDWASNRQPMPGLLSIEIANFANQVRNLDADIFVLIDTAYAAAARLAEQTKPRLWFSTAEAASDLIRMSDYDVRLTGRGQLGVFYAAGPREIAMERATSRLGQVGVFSYQFSESLRKLPAPAIGDLSQEILGQYALPTQIRAPHPVIHASSPNLLFMPAITKIQPNEKDIEIIQPNLKRSAQIIESDADPNVTLVARYVGKEKPYKAIIDGDVIDIDLNGQFRKVLDNMPGRTAVDIRVLSQDFATLSHRSLSLKLSDQDIILNSAGRKLALFIANQDYEDERFNDLQTPKADAEAIRRILTEDFGFSTTIDREDGSELDLFLVNASRGAVSRILFELRKRLTKEDELVIYYAGHGDNVEGAGSYWVPVDGKHDEYFDWIDANDITTELRLMNPASVLLISDSCYSGGLARGETASPASSEARERYLAKARSLRARQLIASGGEEPVEDGGGGGHSIFARALIDGLTTMPGEAFTASELLEQKVKPAVISKPTALSERQIPGFHRVAKAGDEIGSEFIFVRKGAARQAAAP